MKSFQVWKARAIVHTVQSGRQKRLKRQPLLAPSLFLAKPPDIFRQPVMHIIF
jgi:hypothetical protein